MIPVKWVLDNYIKVIWNKNNFPVIRWFLNSTLMAGLSTIISVVLVSVTAYGYTGSSLNSWTGCFYVVMAAILVPVHIVNLIPLYKIVSS